MSRTFWVGLAFSVSGLFLAPVQVNAQTIGPSAQTAADNARGGAVRGRNPGNLVQGGVARHLDFSDRQSMGTVIDELPTEEPFPGLIADALDVIFGQINDAISAFRNLLLVRAGQTPVPASASGTAVNPAVNSNTSGSSGGRR